MRLSWCSSIIGAVLLPALGAAQAPGYRLTYRLDIVRATSLERRTLAAAEVGGPLDTGVRLSLRDATVQIEALLGVFPASDSLTLTVEFFTKRRLGQSRRALPLWEQDGYTRFARLAWGDTVRVYPLGPPQGAERESLWVNVAVQREPAGGETRPAETVTVLPEAGMEIGIEAVVRPRRAVVILNLVRGAAVTGPRRYDLVPEGESRRVEFVLGPDDRRVLEVGLTRPDPLPAGRDRTLALDADFVCLRVTEPATAQAGAAAQPAGVLCGRLNNVARRLPLAGGDTLVAMFAWPGYR